MPRLPIVMTALAVVIAPAFTPASAQTLRQGVFPSVPPPPTITVVPPVRSAAPPPPAVTVVTPFPTRRELPDGTKLDRLGLPIPQGSVINPDPTLPPTGPVPRAADPSVGATEPDAELPPGTTAVPGTAVPPGIVVAPATGAPPAAGRAAAPGAAPAQRPGVAAAPAAPVVGATAPSNRRTCSGNYDLCLTGLAGRSATSRQCIVARDECMKSGEWKSTGSGDRNLTGILRQ